MIRNNNNLRIYNFVLPIWLLVFFPTYLWLFLIPANYLIDRLVLSKSLKSYPDHSAFCKKNTWKICLAGFGSDFLGALFLFLCLELDSETYGSIDALYAISTNPLSNIGSFLLTAIAIAIAGIAIYFADRHILKSNGLDIDQAKKSAKLMAIITAPYLYLLPSELIYGT